MKKQKIKNVNSIIEVIAKMVKIVTTNILTKFVSKQTALMKSVMIDIQTLLGGAPDANFTIQIFVYGQK